MADTKHKLDDVKILVVDDNKNMLELMGTILYAIGVRNVFETTEAAQGLRELQHFKPDIIITDWHMEPMNGVEFVKRVRRGKKSPNPYVPIIMLTGYTEMALVVEARDAGINEFLGKPISATTLYSRVKAIIEKPRAFIRAGAYVGPDRRRRVSDNYPGTNRRTA